MALTDKLTNIANAIREKAGTTEKLTLDAMPTAISALSTGGGGGVNIPDEAFMISGNCDYWDYTNRFDSFITAYSNKWNTSNISSAQYMFYMSKLETIPFELNFPIGAGHPNIQFLFYDCSNLTELPNMNNLIVYVMNHLFCGCRRIRTIPENYADTWDWSYLESQTGSWTGRQDYIFADCYSLRSFPMNIIKSGNPYASYSYAYFYTGFKNCSTLDELNNLPIPYTKAEWTRNAFNEAFRNCCRLKNITFALSDGQPYVVKWKNQIIDLAFYIGYADSNGIILNYNSGITADKEVVDDATYQALKDNPDWFTCKADYSRYNHDSAVATINTLPDTSAYLASAGGTNTIRFLGSKGAKTDGGAINTLTEAEIAVATAKGWTVSFD